LAAELQIFATLGLEGDMAGTAQRLDPGRPGRQAAGLESSLRNLVVGQDEAIRKIVDLYQMYGTGMTCPGRPIGNILFLGPTGSGKTRIVEATAESLYGNADAVIKVNCAEFQHSHEIAKLIGAPPGYLGHRETHPFFSQEALNRCHTETVKVSLVLFDEIEKASDALWNLLLGILDKGILTLGDGRQTDFSHAFIFMTSNLGATEMQSLVRPRWGFATAPGQAADSVGQLSKKLSNVGVEAARKKFTPEFINRLDAMVVFNALGEKELRQVVEIELRRVQERIFSSKAIPFVFRLTGAAVEQLLTEGTDPRYGARHLRRAIDRLLLQPISNLLASEQVRQGDFLVVDSEPDSREMVFLREAEALSAVAMARLAQLPMSQPAAEVVARPERPEYRTMRRAVFGR
jgi:ATP-dependent Clp protease ATP-binding subunit ClpB